MKRLLHAGCGPKVMKPPREYAAMKEVRLDKNPSVNPDVLASIVAMPMLEDDSFDAIFCSHVLEHCYFHEVAMALAEFERVLKPGGELKILAPDLQAIGGKVALDQADCVLYQSSIGVVTALDVMYGHRASVTTGNLHMAHHCGFTQRTLRDSLNAVGFVSVEVVRDTTPGAALQLAATARKKVSNAGEIAEAEGVPELAVRARLGEEARI